MTAGSTPDPAEDLKRRMVPSTDDIERARQVLSRNDPELALTPIAFPGKQHGVWQLDTNVVTGNAVFPCNNDDTFPKARQDCLLAAALLLGEQPGTVGYVVHRTYNGEVISAVFEDFMPPETLIARAAK